MNPKTILISGASGHLGQAVVQHFLTLGHRVIGIVHHSHPKQKQHELYTETELDLTDEGACENTVKILTQRFGNIDVAILTAGGFAMGKLQNTSTANLQQQYKLNFETAYNIARPLTIYIPPQTQTKIFFIGSEPGLNTKKGKAVVAYSLAKSLLFELTNLINADTLQTGVQAQVVVPTTIDTPPNRKAVPKADFDTWQKPEDIATIIERHLATNAQEQPVILIKDELKKSV